MSKQITTIIGDETVRGEGKGGGGGSIESKNTLYSMQTAKALNVISEGPIEGVANIYFDDVNMVSFNDYTNPDASKHIVKVHIPNTTDGTIQHGESTNSVIQGFTDIENEIRVGSNVTQLGGPVVFSVSSPLVDSVNVTINVPALFAVDGKGNIKGNKFSFTIEKRPNPTSVWELEQNVEVKGKCNSPYSCSYHVNKPNNSQLWEVRLTRTSADQDSAKAKNGFSWSSMTEIQHTSLTYDNTALVALAVDARATNNKIPVMSFDVAGIKVKVPSNYTPRLPVDPVTKPNGQLVAKWVEDFRYENNQVIWSTRTQLSPNALYSPAIWDGTFKTARVWTDNPAWILYDLLTNERYGLGNRIKPEDIDHYSFYDAAVYCDELVSDGNGGLEPRFTFNGSISARDTAFKIIQNVASAMHANLLDVGGVISVIQDRPISVSQIVTNSDVIDGNFEYSSSGLGSRHTAASVSYNDPHDRFLVAVVSESDTAGIARYGYNTVEENAVGCTSEAQARRHARWRLFTDLYTTQVVAFKVALRNCLIQPGELIEIQDQNFAEIKYHGLVKSATSTQIVLDNPVDLLNKTYSIDFYGSQLDANGQLPIINKQIIQKNGSFSTFTFASPLTDVPAVNSSIIIKGDVAPLLFKVITITEESQAEFNISAVEYKAEKFNYIDSGIVAANPKYDKSIGFNNFPPTSVKFTELSNRELMVSWSAPTDKQIIYGTASGGSTTSLILPPESFLATDYYKNWTVNILTGSAAGQSAFIKSYTASTRTATLSNTLTTAIDSSSTYSLTPPAIIVNSYNLEYTVDDGQKITVRDIHQPFYIIKDPKYADYEVTVTAVNMRGINSAPATESYNYNDHYLSGLDAVTDLKIIDGVTNSIYASRDVTFTWLNTAQNIKGIWVDPLDPDNSNLWSYSKCIDYQVDVYDNAGTMVGSHIVPPIMVQEVDTLHVSKVNSNKALLTAKDSIPAAKNYYNGWVIKVGLESRTVTAFDYTTGTFTLNAALSSAPALNTSFTVTEQSANVNSGGKFLYKFEDNINDFSVATRDYSIKVYTRDASKRLSLPTELVVTNPVPASGTLLASAGIMQNTLSFSAGSAISDLAGYRFYGSTTSGFNPLTQGTLIYEGMSSQCVHNVPTGGIQWFYVAGMYDSFDDVVTNWSNQAAATAAAALDASQIQAVLDLSNDNILSSFEKPALLNTWNSIVSETSVFLNEKNIAAATAYPVLTEYNAYIVKFQALADYLNAGTTWTTGDPNWLNSTNILLDTAIVGTTFRTKFKDYYEAKGVLITAVSNSKTNSTTDAKAKADLAKTTADTAVTNAATAANAAAQAQTDATSALNTLGDIASDNKITAGERPTIHQDWYTIYQEYNGTILTTATTAGILTTDAVYTNYVAAFNTLRTYLISAPISLTSNPTTTDAWITGTATINITGSNFRNNFANYYYRKVDLLNAISDKLNSKAVLAKTTADTAVTNAATALSAANQAQTDATSALTNLNDITSDNTITVNEKPSLYVQYKAIYDEYTDILAKATDYGITTEKTNYSTSYTALVTYMTASPISMAAVPVDSWATNTTKITIVGTTMRAKFTDYYNVRQLLLNAIATKAKLLADTAQTTANSALANAATAQTKADSAFTNAATAQTDINDISSDNKITQAEKPKIFIQWKSIYDEQITISTNATTYGITTEKTDYQTSYTTLANYLTATPISIQTPPTDGATWCASTSKITIVGTTFRNNFTDYFAKRQLLLNAIALKAKTLADGAQSSANTAISNAATAQTAATNAATDAALANSELGDFADDNKIVKAEKPPLHREWLDIYTEQPDITAKATTYGITTEKTAYTTAYNALVTYLTGAPLSMPAVPTSTDTWLTSSTKITIVGSTFRQNFSTYYEKRQLLLNAIAAKAKTLADAAQTTASQGVSDAAAANTAATNAATTANAAATEIADLSSDNKIVPAEKPNLHQQWMNAYNEQADIVAKATSYGITTEKTNYSTAYSTLATYLTGTPLSMPAAPAISDAWVTATTKFTIVGTTFRTNWYNYYNTRQLLLNAIYAKAKAIADAAQTDATSALTAANLASTNATNAVTTANAANTEISDLSDDNKIVLAEKPALHSQWYNAVQEKSDISAKGTTYSITTELTNYNSAYTTLSNYLTASPILLPATPAIGDAWVTATNKITIVGSTMRTNWSNYYSTRQLLLNAISAKAKTIADAAALTSTWSGVTGTGKPADNATVGATWGTNITSQPTSLSGINSTEGTKLSGIATGATKNTVYQQSTAPSSGMAINDIWVNTGAPTAIYTYNGSTWVLSSTVGATSAQVTDISDRLSKSANNVLSGSGALSAGNIVINSSGVRVSGAGILMSSGGLNGYDSLGNATFSIDTSGNATFKGDLTGSTGTFTGALQVGSSPLQTTGPTMTGSGAIFNSGGTFAIGNATTNIAFDGTTLKLNGNVVGTTEIKANAVTSYWTGSSTPNTRMTTAGSGVTVTTSKFTMPTDGTLVVNILGVVHNNSTSTDYRIQHYAGAALYSSTGSSQGSYTFNPKYWKMCPSGADTYNQFGPYATYDSPAGAIGSNGSMESFNAQYSIAVTAGQQVEFFFSAIVASSNALLYYDYMNYVAVLYKR